jgi:peptidoglycan/LPS O-acetylase OafA/YrhL
VKKIIENSTKICFYIAIFHAAVLTFYTVTAFIAAIISGDIERMDTFITENVVYAVLIISIFLTAYGFKAKKRFSFAPFLLIQLFAIIIAWQLVQGERLFIQIGGFVIIILAFLGLIVALIPQNRQKFL